MRNVTFNKAFTFLWVAGLAFVMAFSSCKKDETEPDPVNLTELPGVAFLGHGYNTFGDWANPDEVKNAMISFENYRKVVVNGADYKLPEEVEYTML